MRRSTRELWTTRCGGSPACSIARVVGDRYDLVASPTSTPLYRHLEACAADLPLWSLPDGSAVAGINGHELAYMVWEQDDCDTYRLGDLDRDDAVIVDAGANIGLFALTAASRSPSTRVVCVEPMPPVADVLRANVALHGLGDQVAIQQVGLGPEPGTATFRFAPFFSALSSRHQAERADICRRLALGIRFLLPSAAKGTDLDLGQAKAWINEQVKETPHEVEIATLSDVFRREQLDRIDLLKVDVEGSELEILHGIADEDWPRIERLAIEVNDVDGRLGAIRALLSAQGFMVTVEDDPSASRVVPVRIAIVHASRRPLGDRRPGPGRQLVTEASVVAEAEAILAPARQLLDQHGANGVALRLCAATAAGRPSERPGADLLDAVTGPLATLLSVDPVRLSAGWRHHGLITHPEVRP